MSKIVDNNRLPDIKRAIEDLKKYQLQVGIFAPEGSELYMIAMVHEYGVSIKVTEKMRAYLHYTGLHLKADTTEIVIPERSYIRAGYDNVKGDVNKLARGLLPKVIHLEMSAKQMYDIIGDYIAGQIHEYIASLQTPPLHPYTVEHKKANSNKPLIDTGRLNQAVTWRVVTRNGMG